MCNLETYCHKKHGNLFHLAEEIQGLPNFAVIDAFRILVDATEHAFAQEQKIMENYLQEFNNLPPKREHSEVSLPQLLNNGVRGFLFQG
jgi:hypothetical protein